MSEALLKDRDYTVIVAKTAPSVVQTPPGYEQRWENAHTAILALIKTCETFDPDGITIYISSEQHSGFEQYKQVTTAKLVEILDAHLPPLELNLLDSLRLALNDYFDRKVAGQTKPNGEVILVLIDGEPKDRMAIAKAIVETTEKLGSPEELKIGFLQVGDDIIARGFLEALDDNLKSSIGAKFDIVNTKVLEEIEPNCLTSYLLDILRN